MQLMTDEYKKLTKQYHIDCPEYGGNNVAKNWSAPIADIIKTYKVTSILDYGCGKGLLKQTLRDLVPVFINYDPGINEFETLPTGKFDLVLCMDVMEHVEKEFTNEVLNDIFNLTHKLVFFNIAVTPARKILPDGRNTHININPERVWLEMLQKWFNFINVSRVSAKNYAAINYFGSSIKYNGN